MSTARSVGAAVVSVTLMLSVALIAGCSSTVDGNAVSIYNDPFTVAGLPATSGPSGPRPGVAPSTLEAENGDGGDVDQLAVDAVDDIQTYWKAEYPKHFKGQFQPVDRIVSWDSDAPRGSAIEFCQDRTAGVANAGYCTKDNTIGWDRTNLLPAMIDAFGPMSVVMVLAHEYGHAVQFQSGIVGEDEPGIVFEQQADCFAGAFIRHVAEGGAPHFTINTSDGLNSVLAATVSIRDSDPNDPESIHGSAFERVTAVQIGFTDGPDACAKIDEKEIDSRRADLPQQFSSPSDTGELPVTQASLTEFVKALQSIFALPQEPKISYTGADTGCADARATEPVSYCPTTDTIGVDIPALAERGTPRQDPGNGLPVTVTGDYNAYVVFGSRFTLAVQQNEKQSLTEAKTALRAACLSGVVTTGLASDRGPDAGDFTLSPGDLDEAVSGLLTDGLAASDVNGKTVPSGFARIDAFRSGVLGGQSACNGRYG
ncbi:metallopeptidase [Antrihabitans cavernicola]|uniref:Metallopeptidase n=1 Tax=Antrihabitans cavernicola TaxID=2495913 RepID=A0A5A7SDJ7_9NOCA|nr:metallopeptidase [Spelaeibacter cavernicola]KAA0022817.1 metallopeptidase [Spelaeibacter cavernicola]